MWDTHQGGLRGNGVPMPHTVLDGDHPLLPTNNGVTSPFRRLANDIPLCRVSRGNPEDGQMKRG